MLQPHYKYLIASLDRLLSITFQVTGQNKITKASCLLRQTHATFYTVQAK